MKEILVKISDKAIRYCFYLLFFLVPLVLTPYNYELFEYNKMMLTYGLTVVIAGSWIVKMILEKEVRIAKTPLDLPIILFLASQIISTIFSLDHHVSIWGYYSRFNGGLLSTFSYILLYYAFVSNFPKEKIRKLLFLVLSSGFIVSIYGILEHFGIDKDLWVQDVQNRVFSTLGQPNWLAAYLAVLIPLTLGISLQSLSTQYLDFEDKNQKSKIKNQKYNVNLKNTEDTSGVAGWTPPRWRNWITLLVYSVIGSIFYICLLFTKSRSGFLGFWLSLTIFWGISLILAFLTKIQSSKTQQNYAAANFYWVSNGLIGIFLVIFIFITFILGAPFSEIDRFTFKELTKNKTSTVETPIKSTGSSVIDIGITESGTIRHIVWKGAIEIFRHYPLFGTGVETFAFAYYKFRPIEHNMTSEWDFLYNKAHNEYLNYAATTGIFGLGSYLLFIGGFIWWNIKKIKKQKTCHPEFISEPVLKSFQKSHGIPKQVRNDTSCQLLHLSFFSAWLSILVTNFFGFSVVIVQLFFFLIPAVSFVFSTPSAQAICSSSTASSTPPSRSPYGHLEGVLTVIILFAICYLLFAISRLWYADTLFSAGYHFSRTSDYLSAHKSLKEAIALNANEPLYYDELAYPAAQLAVVFGEDKEASYSTYLKEEAILASQLAVTLSPNNVNYWKTRTRVFYTLYQLDEKYLNDAFTDLVQAKTLSPTDPKISYNLALLYDKLEKSQEAITELTETTRLKPDYRDAYFALGLFYQRDNQKEKAREAFNFILNRIATDDADVKKMLEELK